MDTAVNSETAQADTRSHRVPVSLITGFLGSGKTTLLNHLVKQPGMETTALIINEFGETGLDHLLVETSIENTLLLENGCICCSIRGDLVDTLLDLFRKVESGQLPAFDRILIETTGIADPVPIVRTIDEDAVAADHCRLDRVVTVVDGVQGLGQISEHDEAVAQVAIADALLLSKSDLVDDDASAELSKKLVAINPAARIYTVARGVIDPKLLFSGERTAASAVAFHGADDGHGHVGGHRHGAITTCCLVHEPPVAEERIREWLRMLITLRPYSLLRVKGYAHISGIELPLLFQTVGSVVSRPTYLDAWPDGKPETRFVLIFRDLSPEIVSSCFRRHVVDTA